MKLLKTLLCSAVAVAGINSASAIVYEFEYPEPPAIAFLDQNNPYYSDVLDFAADLAGFSSSNSLSWATHYIHSAVLEFGFADDQPGYNGDSAEKIVAGVKIDDTGDWTQDWRALELEADDGDLPSDGNAEVEGTNVSTEVEVDGSHTYGYDYREGALIDGVEYDKIENGEAIEFAVLRKDGDTYLKTVSLKVDIREKSTPPTHSVPDTGSTLALFGLSFLGLISLRRKLK